MNLIFINFTELAEAVSTIGLLPTIILAIVASLIFGIKWLGPKLWKLVDETIKNKIEEQKEKDNDQDLVVAALSEQIEAVKKNITTLKNELDNSKSLSKERHETLVSSIKKLEGTVDNLVNHLFNLMIKK
jgi:polyhydroxyalkanoate synthesis regulator phasin